MKGVKIYLPTQNMLLQHINYSELKAIENHRYRKKPLWIFPFLTKSKIFREMRIDFNPLCEEFCGHKEHGKFAPKMSLHRQILLK